MPYAQKNTKPMILNKYSATFLSVMRLKYFIIADFLRWLFLRYWSVKIYINYTEFQMILGQKFTLF